MKNLIIVLALATLLSAGCRNKKSSEHTHHGEAEHEHAEGTHEHEDGSVHQDHDTSHHQETFILKGDSTFKKEEKHEHKPGDDHQH